MIDVKKMGTYISMKRHQAGLTQRQIAAKLHVSFQAVSKWEKGDTSPSLDMLVSLAGILGGTVDDLIRGADAAALRYSYAEAGVDIAYTDGLKEAIATYVETSDPRLIGHMRQFAALYDLENETLKEPVLVLKAEEPGSKQKLAMQYGYTYSICHDMVNHLVNDIAVMGAKPLAVLDTIVCDSAEKDTILSIIRGISDACKANECVLAGGETSIQPGVVGKGTYILTSSIVGMVDKTQIIDGSRTADGDVVLAVASNGLHTNGYSLVRMLMADFPGIMQADIDGETFLEAIMRPHAAYYTTIKGLFANPGVKGMAHITGGGLAANLARVIPDGLSAHVRLNDFHPPALFRFIQKVGGIADDEMLRTFNCGVGLVIIVDPMNADAVRDHVSKYFKCYPIGRIRTDDERIRFHDTLGW